MNEPTADLQDIYRRTVLEHSRHPHNFGRPDEFDQEATGFNPLCGDRLSVYLQTGAGDMLHAAFEGTGCAICIASASMMTDALQGQPVARARQLIRAVHAMFSDSSCANDEVPADMQALAGVRNYPSRIKCATLAWTTLDAALSGNTQQVSTEN